MHTNAWELILLIIHYTGKCNGAILDRLEGWDRFKGWGYFSCRGSSSCRAYRSTSSCLWSYAIYFIDLQLYAENAFLWKDRDLKLILDFEPVVSLSSEKLFQIFHFIKTLCLFISYNLSTNSVKFYISIEMLKTIT